MTLFKGKYRIESTRLKEWDYGSSAWYFVTICTRDRECSLGKIVEGQMHLSRAGEIVKQCWEDIPLHQPYASLDAHVIMPNHMHGILAITTTTSADTTLRYQSQEMSVISPRVGELGTVIRSYKSAVTRMCNQGGFYDFAWQTRYYEHIIRSERALQALREYIENNPMKWDMDQDNPIGLKM